MKPKLEHVIGAQGVVNKTVRLVAPESHGGAEITVPFVLG